MNTDQNFFSMVKLSSVAKIQPGFAFKSERFTDNPSDIRLVKGESVQQGFIDWQAARYWPESEKDEFEEFILKPGDIVVAMDRPWVEAGLKWAYIREKDPVSLLVQRVSRLTARKELDQTYLRCLISSSYFAAYLKPIVTGVNIPHISGKQIGDFLIPLPSIEVQKKIAAILSAYDDLIANNQRRITLFESMAEEIYREWFVRGRTGSYAAEVRTAQPFDRLCTLQRGFDLPDSAMQAGSVPVIAATSIKGYHNVARVKPPVITTGRSGSLGTVLLTQQPAWPLNTTLYVKNFSGNSPYFVYFTLKSLKLENFNAGAGVPTLNRNHLLGIHVSIPSHEMQQHFDDLVIPLIKSADILRALSNNLVCQRNSLLPRLISGKLKVAHLDIQFPPSMREDAAA